MNHTCSATHSRLYYRLICILLPFYPQLRRQCNCTKPVVAIVNILFAISILERTGLLGLAVDTDAGNIGQKLFVERLHMFMVFDVFVRHRHLAATDTGADVRHTIVVSNLFMLIVRIALSSLSGIPHNRIGPTPALPYREGVLKCKSRFHFTFEHIRRCYDLCISITNDPETFDCKPFSS